MSKPFITTKTRGVMSGIACIAGTRIPVWAVESFRRAGRDTWAIIEEYPTLMPRQVRAAFRYADAHREELDRDLGVRTPRPIRSALSAALKEWRAAPAFARRDIIRYLTRRAKVAETRALTADVWREYTPKQHLALGRAMKASAIVLSAASTKRTL